jgi:hypothetical protein
MLYFKDKTSAEQAGYKAYSGCFWLIFLPICAMIYRRSGIIPDFMF